jgi:hypothetical protein
MIASCTKIGAIVYLENALGISFPNLIWWIMLLGGIIWFGKDWKTGVYYLFFMYAMGFVITYSWGCYEYVNFLYVMLGALIMMSLTLYTGAKAKQEGQQIS